MVNIDEVRRIAEKKLAELTAKKAAIEAESKTRAENIAKAQTRGILAICEAKIIETAKQGLREVDVYNYFKYSPEPKLCEGVIINTLRDVFKQRGFGVLIYDHEDDGNTYYGTYLRVSW